MRSFRHVAILAASISFAFATPALAQEFPLVPGEYVEMTSVTIDDGHNLDYAKFLANVHKRPGEADLYLIQRSKSLPDGAESQRRDAVMRDKMKMTEAEMEASSGERAKFRHVTGSSLLQVLNFK